MDLPSGEAVEVKCEAEGKYVTLATPRDMVLCDIFVTGEVRFARARLCTPNWEGSSHPTELPQPPCSWYFL